MTSTSFINSFSEDNNIQIPIRAIYVDHIGDNVRDKDLREHFENFGEVTSVMFPLDFLNIDFGVYAVIIFEKPEYVNRVLNQKTHTLRNKQVYVKIAPDWLQPEFIEDVRPTLIDDSILRNDIPDNSLLKINDDCILRIFSFLHLSDQVKLSELCSRLNRVGQIIFRKLKNVYFNGMEFKTATEGKYALKKIGKNIEYLRFSPTYMQMQIPLCGAFFPFLCPNLRILEFANVAVDYGIIKWLMPVIKDLEELVLKYCPLSDDVLINLESCTKLKVLDLSTNLKATGVFLKTLPNSIEDLNISRCLGIRPEHFINLCKVAKFKKLDIRDNHYLFDPTILEQLCKMESLETIYLNTGMSSIDFSRIANIPNLKHLYAVCKANLDDIFYEVLESKKSETLETLHLIGVEPLNDFKRQIISNFKNLKRLEIVADDELLRKLVNSNVCLIYLNLCHSQKVSDDGLLNFLEKSRTIETVNIRSCKQFNSSFVLKLIEKLKWLHCSNCLKLLADNTNICPSIQDDPMYKNYNHIIKVMYQKPFCEKMISPSDTLADLRYVY